jgi:hypothetical protein
MTSIVHRLGGALALVTIATFWIATLVTEAFASEAVVIQVKTAIPWGLLILVPALAMAGGSGFRLARGRRGGVLGAKARRMPIIAANGIFVLVPAALYLAVKAQAADFDAAFYGVQALELVAGAANLALIGLNVRDGLRLTGRVPRRAA